MGGGGAKNRGDGKMHLRQAAERGWGRWKIRIQKRGWDWDSATYHADAPPREVGEDGGAGCKRKNRVNTNGEYKKKKKRGAQGEKIQYGFGGAWRVISYGTEWGAGQTGRCYGICWVGYEYKNNRTGGTRGRGG